MIVHTYVPAIQPVADVLVKLSHKCLALTIFLIGAGLSGKVIRAIGWQPLAQDVLLRVLISAVSLWTILTF